MIDIHCHILPGLDDGAQSMADALEMAAAAEQEGITKIIATPHLFRDTFEHDDLTVIEKKQKELTRTEYIHHIQLSKPLTIKV